MEEFKIIKLDKPVSTLSGNESWVEVELREPLYTEVSDFYKETKKSDEHDAMAKLISEVSGVNLIAVKHLPIRKFREAQAFMLGFLNYFPQPENGES